MKHIVDFLSFYLGMMLCGSFLLAVHALFGRDVVLVAVGSTLALLGFMRCREACRGYGIENWKSLFGKWWAISFSPVAAICFYMLQGDYAVVFLLGSLVGMVAVMVRVEIASIPYYKRKNQMESLERMRKEMGMEESCNP